MHLRSGFVKPELDDKLSFPFSKLDPSIFTQTNMSTDEGKTDLTDIGFFYGDKTLDTESIQGHFKKIELYAELRNWDMARKLTIAKLSFRKIALQRLTIINAQTYDELKKQMTDKFNELPAAEEIANKLHKIKQGTQSVDDYAKSIDILLAQMCALQHLPPSDTYLYDIFISGLHPALMDGIKIAGIKTYNEAVIKAKEIEYLSKRSPAPVTSQISGSDSNSLTFSNKQEEEDYQTMTALMNKFNVTPYRRPYRANRMIRGRSNNYANNRYQTMNTMPQSQGSVNSNGMRRGFNYAHRRRPTRSFGPFNNYAMHSTATSRSNVLCFKCHLRGHYANTCSSRGSNFGQNSRGRASHNSNAAISHNQLQAPYYCMPTRHDIQANTFAPTLHNDMNSYYTSGGQIMHPPASHQSYGAMYNGASAQSAAQVSGNSMPQPKN